MDETTSPSKFRIELKGGEEENTACQHQPNQIQKCNPKPSVEDVLDHARERLRDGMPGGGYILSTACSVSPLVEPEKLEALKGLVEDEGQY